MDMKQKFVLIGSVRDVTIFENPIEVGSSLSFLKTMTSLTYGINTNFWSISNHLKVRLIHINRTFNSPKTLLGVGGVSTLDRHHTHLCYSLPLHYSLGNLFAIKGIEIQDRLNNPAFNTLSLFNLDWRIE